MGFISNYTRPNRAKRIRENAAQAQRDHLSRQADQQREAARLHKEGALAQLKIVIEKTNAEIEAWYAAELASANADYILQQDEYQTTLHEISESRDQIVLQLSEQFEAQQANLIMDQVSDAEFLEQCSVIVKQLAIEIQGYEQSQFALGNENLRQLVAMTQEFEQMLVALNSNYALLIQQVENQWLEYQNQYNVHIANLKANRDAQLSAVAAYEAEEIAKIEATYQEHLVAINQELRKRLQEVNNALQEQLKHLKHVARAFLITAATIVVASLATYYSAGILAGFSSYLIEMVQTALAVTSLRATERLVNGSDSFGIDVSINLAPQPTPQKFTPAVAPNIELNALFADSTFDLEAFQRRFEEFGQNVAPGGFSNNLPYTSNVVIQSSEPKLTTSQPLSHSVNFAANSKDLEENVANSLLIGTGRVIAAAGQGIKQFSLECGTELRIVEPEVLAKYTKDINKERDLYKSTPVSKSTSGQIGEFASEALLYSVVPAGSGLRGVKLAAAGTASTGLIAAVQPTYEGTWTTRGQNAAVGAVAGAVIAPAVGKLYGTAKTGMVKLYDARITSQSLGANPFYGKSFEQIAERLEKPGGARSEPFTSKGIDPANGKGSYFHPTSGRKYYLDKAGKKYKGNVVEEAHVDIHRKNIDTGKIIEDMSQLSIDSKLTNIKRKYPLGDELYTFEKPKP